MKITKEIIAKIGSDQAKEYVEYSNKPLTYEELLFEFLRDSVPFDEVENYLVEKQEIAGDDSLADYVTAGEYALMINDILLFRGEVYDPTEFKDTFNEWFYIELKELLSDYGVNLNAPVDVSKMESVVKYENFQ